MVEGSFPHAVNCILGDRSLMLHEWTFPQLYAEREGTLQWKVRLL